MKKSIIKLISSASLFTLLAIGVNAHAMQIFVKTLTGKTISLNDQANVDHIKINTDYYGDVTCDLQSGAAGGDNGYTCQDAAGGQYTLQLLSEGTYCR